MLIKAWREGRCRPPDAPVAASLWLCRQDLGDQADTPAITDVVLALLEDEGLHEEGSALGDGRRSPPPAAGSSALGLGMYYDKTAEKTDELPLTRTSSLTGALERELERLILSGEIKPGERLNEIQLSTRFGTSRGPLREATRSLQGRGLVEVVRNRGVFVRAVSAREALEIYDVRAALFGLAGRLLVDRLSDDMLRRLNDYLDRMDAVAGARDFDRYYPLNLEFHDFLVSSTGNETLLDGYRSFVNKLHLFRARNLVQAGGLAVSNREHRAMVDALASGDRERAQETFFRHVERAKLRIAGTMEGPKGQIDPK